MPVPVTSVPTRKRLKRLVPIQSEELPAPAVEAPALEASGGQDAGPVSGTIVPAAQPGELQTPKGEALPIDAESRGANREKVIQRGGGKTSNRGRGSKASGRGRGRGSQASDRDGGRGLKANSGGRGTKASSKGRGSEASSGRKRGKASNEDKGGKVSRGSRASKGETGDKADAECRVTRGSRGRRAAGRGRGRGRSASLDHKVSASKAAGSSTDVLEETGSLAVPREGEQGILSSCPMDANDRAWIQKHPLYIKIHKRGYPLPIGDREILSLRAFTPVQFGGEANMRYF